MARGRGGHRLTLAAVAALLVVLGVQIAAPVLAPAPLAPPTAPGVAAPTVIQVGTPATGGAPTTPASSVAPSVPQGASIAMVPATESGPGPAVSPAPTADPGPLEASVAFGPSAGILPVTSTYNVTFSEVGLPDGTVWSVTMDETRYSAQAPAPVVADLPNGTFSYAITDVSGWHQNTLPYRGSDGPVQGGPYNVGPLVFLPVLYSVSFTESGLPATSGNPPSPTVWSMYIDGSPLFATAGTPITTTLSNGTFTYRVGPISISGWHQTTIPYTNQSAVLTPSGFSLALTFTPVTYSVTISETGLPSGEELRLTVGSVTNATPTGVGTTLLTLYGLVNGTYNYTLSDLSGWHQSTIAYTGSIVVDGGTGPTDGTGLGYAFGTMAYTAVLYTATFTSTDLPDGESWNVNLTGAGCAYAATCSHTNVESGSAEFALPNGTYTYAVTSGGLFFAPSPATDPITVNGAVAIAPSRSSTQAVVFTLVTQALEITTALPTAGESWNVNLTGAQCAVYAATCTAVNQVGTSFTFDLPNGTYGFVVTSGGKYYAATPGSGSVTVSGSGASPPSITVSWAAQLQTATFTTTQPTSGESWFVNATTALARCAYAGAVCRGTNSGTMVDLSLFNGTYAYTVASGGFYYRASPGAGAFSVSGSSSGLIATVAWSAETSAVTFRTMLPTSQESWFVNATIGLSLCDFAGSTCTGSGSSSTISLQLFNGSYAYAVTSGGLYYHPAPGVGAITVTGSGAMPSSVSVGWTAVTHLAEFTESGLAAGESWSVNGTTLSARCAYTGAICTGTSAAGTITLALLNGSYTYTVASGGLFFAPNPSGGTVSVSGSGATIEPGGSSSQAVDFELVAYSVSLSASGLPPDENWEVLATGGGCGFAASCTTSGTTTLLAMSLPNGTYTLTPSAGGGYLANPSSESAVVAGGPTARSWSFSVYSPGTYVVQFIATGFTGGERWGVTINGTLESATGAGTIVVALANGSYPYALEAVAGWYLVDGEPNGTVVVDGLSQNISLEYGPFTYAVTFTESGLPGTLSWGVVLNGALLFAAAGTPITSQLPNGTFTYAIVDVPGWHQTTLAYVDLSAGPVNDAPESFGPIVFTPVAYRVTISESGLPSGESLRLRVGSVTNSITTDGGTDTLVLSNVANGSYSYALTDLSGWHQSTIAYAGTVTVDGGSTAINGTGLGYGFPSVSYGSVSYEVSITETGLPSGATFQLTVGTVERSLDASGGTETLTLSGLANGSYAYTLADISGWHQTVVPYAGTIRVNGSVEPINGTGTGYSFRTTTYAAVTYIVNLSETGLPSGEELHLTVGSRTNSTITGDGDATLTLSGLANGTYGYALSDIAGWHESTISYTGSIPVNGGTNSTIGAGLGYDFGTVVYAAALYRVTITESGLPSGETFRLTVGTATDSITTDGGDDTLSVGGLANGTYTYALADVPGWHQATLPYTGTVLVNGGTNPINGTGLGQSLGTVTFGALLYSITFEESGLPPSSAWAATIAGQLYFAAAGETLVTPGMPNGTYAYALYDVAGWHQLSYPYTGDVTISGANVTYDFAFTQVLYAVTFTESGLPGDLTWSMTINGTAFDDVSAGTPITTELPNGTFRYVVADVPGWHQTTVPYANSSAGPIRGGPYSVGPLVFAPTTYAASFTETGLAPGVEWGISVDGIERAALAGAPIVVPLPNGTFIWQALNVAGWHLTEPEYYLIQTANQSEAGFAQGLTFFEVLYPVDFTESGLPLSVGEWGLSLNGTTYSASVGAPIDLDLPNGTFDYAIDDIAGWHQPTIPYSGTLTIDNDSRSVPTMQFAEVTWAVTFEETGLPAGTLWSVTLAGNVSYSEGRAIHWTIANGTYPFTVSATGFVADPASGSLSVLGVPITEAIAFARPPLTMTFGETGLAQGVSWTVRFNNATESAVAPNTIVFEGLANGTYSYNVSAVPGYLLSAPTGSVTIDGGSASTMVPFAMIVPGTTVVTFTESGVPAGNPWSVLIVSGTSNATYHSDASTIVVQLANGSYTYRAVPVGGYAAQLGWTAAFSVLGVGPLAFSVEYAYAYPITYAPTGLSTGTLWSIEVALSLSGEAAASASVSPSFFANSTSASLSFLLANGTYTYTISASGYASARGTTPVAGSPAVVPVALSANGTPSLLPWLLVGVVVAAGTLVSLFLLIRRYRGRRTPPPPGEAR